MIKDKSSRLPAWLIRQQEDAFSLRKADRQEKLRTKPQNDWAVL